MSEETEVHRTKGTYADRRFLEAALKEEGIAPSIRTMGAEPDPLPGTDPELWFTVSVLREDADRARGVLNRLEEADLVVFDDPADEFPRPGMTDRDRMWFRLGGVAMLAGSAYAFLAGGVSLGVVMLFGAVMTFGAAMRN